jgi:hypothetical protein
MVTDRVFVFLVVIPAKAGIHVDLEPMDYRSVTKMSGNDELGDPATL